MENFTKVVRLGVYCPGFGGRGFSVFCAIEYKDGRLRITGVEGPLASGNARGGCGQISMHMDSEYLDHLVYAPGWNREKAERFIAIWNEWHLNDMKAGTPAQEAELKNHTWPGYSVSHYNWACKVLSEAGLQPDNGYSYGSAWLKVDVPEDVLEWLLRALPDTDKKPAWV
jgi:hypothetical protein